MLLPEGADISIRKEAFNATTAVPFIAWVLGVFAPLTRIGEASCPWIPLNVFLVNLTLPHTIAHGPCLRLAQEPVSVGFVIFFSVVRMALEPIGIVGGIGPAIGAIVGSPFLFSHWHRKPIIRY